MCIALCCLTKSFHVYYYLISSSHQPWEVGRTNGLMTAGPYRLKRGRVQIIRTGAWTQSPACKPETVIPLNRTIVSLNPLWKKRLCKLLNELIPPLKEGRNGSDSCGCSPDHCYICVCFFLKLTSLCSRVVVASTYLQRITICAGRKLPLGRLARPSKEPDGNWACH